MLLKVKQRNDANLLIEGMTSQLHMVDGKTAQKQNCGGNRGVRMDKPESSDVTIQIKEHRQCLSGLVIAGTENKQYVVLTIAYWLDLRDTDIIIHN